MHISVVLGGLYEDEVPSIVESALCSKINLKALAPASNVAFTVKVVHT